MLRIRALTLTDFGPFKNEQRIAFRAEPGVTVFTGANGRGKTWLLNAIRYALFGHVLGRTDIARDLSRVANWETAKATGRKAFKVVLEFDFDETPYQLTRTFDDGGDDAGERRLLVRDGSVLSQDDTDRALDRVLPEQIARFFLFDGELLRQYEELAVDPSRGEELKAAIERILGIPILTNARTDISALQGRLNRALAQAAASRAQTQQLGVNLQDAQDRLDQFLASADALGVRLDELEHEKADLDEQMARSERAVKLIARRTSLTEERGRHARELEGLESTLKARTALAWKAVVAPAIEKALRDIDADIGGLTERRKRADLAKLTAEQRRTAVDTGHCPTCGQTVDGAFLPHDGVDPDDRTELDMRLQDQLARRAGLLALRDTDTLPTIREVETRLDSTRVQIADLDNEINDIQDELQNAPEAVLRELALRMSNVQSALERTKADKDRVDGEVAQQQLAVRQLREALAGLGVANLESLQKKAELLQDLHDLFGSAITHYRERLRGQVESEATRIFRLLRTEEDYERLEINAGYGLTIIHKDGEAITDRSAGYEHLVALALLGALQRSAPIRGPVIMDSPLGRLDPDHKASVVAALPEIADQVILLAYNNEFDRDGAARRLGTKLIAEKELVRITARHTVIRDRGEPA